MPERLPQAEYESGEIVRSVSTTKAYVSFKGRSWKCRRPSVASASLSDPPTSDGVFGIFFASRQVATIDLTGATSVSDVPGQVSAMSPG
jgi:hypothetical protein